MARPLKQGLDYFSTDCSFYQDIRIRKLIKYNGGVQAVAVYHILLCMIYGKGYYMEWDDDLPFVLYEQTGLEEAYILQVINSAVDVGLFDATLFHDEKILTSKSIQKRYFAAWQQAKRKVYGDIPYLLTDIPFLTTQKTGSQQVSEQTLDFTEETGVNSEDNKENTEETVINPGKSTQKKEKESKDNNSLRSSLSVSSSTTSSAPAREAFEDTTEGEDETSFVSVDDAVVLLKADGQWLRDMQHRHHIPADQLLRWLDAFVTDCKCRGKTQHTSLSDVMQHFNDWLIKQKKPSSSRPAAAGTSQKMTPIQRWTRCQADMCKSVTDKEVQDVFSHLAFESFTPENNIVLLRVPSKDIYETLEARYVNLLTRMISKYFGNVTLNYRINS